MSHSDNRGPANDSLYYGSRWKGPSWCTTVASNVRMPFPVRCRASQVAISSQQLLEHLLQQISGPHPRVFDLADPAWGLGMRTSDKLPGLDHQLELISAGFLYHHQGRQNRGTPPPRFFPKASFEILSGISELKNNFWSQGVGMGEAHVMTLASRENSTTIYVRGHLLDSGLLSMGSNLTIYFYF